MVSSSIFKYHRDYLLKHVMQDSTRGEDRVSVRLADLCSLDCGLHPADGGFETLRGENSGHQLADTTNLSQGSVESSQISFSPRITCCLGGGSMGCLGRIRGLGLHLTKNEESVPTAGIRCIDFNTVDRLGSAFSLMKFNGFRLSQSFRFQITNAPLFSCTHWAGVLGLRPSVLSVQFLRDQITS